LRAFRLRLDANEAGSLATQGNLESVNGVDGGVAGGGAADNNDARFWSKAHVHEVVSNLVGQIERFNNRCCAYPQFAQCAQVLVRVIFDGGIRACG
jgi:hypothetical protein